MQLYFMQDSYDENCFLINIYRLLNVILDHRVLRGLLNMNFLSPSVVHRKFIELHV